MTDRRGNVRSTGHQLPNVSGDHRLNDVNCGHLGRLTYVPVDTDEEQAGRLHTTRNIELTPHFKQIVPVEELCRPSRSVLPEVKSRPWRAVRSHRNWLLKSHPQALLGSPDLGALLSQETRGLKDADAAPPISSLLALGEITDLREAIQVTGQPAVAFAAGEGGHILQILTLTPDERGWNDEGLALRFGTTQSSGRGQWIEDGNPITVIKFAVDPQKYDPIRWILVQKETSTIVLEPEMRKTPLKGDRLGGIDSRGAMQISANPLFAISADKTGGGSQSDVTFNPASSGASPQLAIINKAGYWSIWDVTGSRAARPKVLRPVLRVCGSMDSGPIPALPLGSWGNQTVHRVSWLSQSKEASPQGQNYPERTPRLLARADHILACNDTALRVISIADGKFQTGLSVARTGKAERILDVRICPFDPSKAFVLTTTTLFWVSNEPAGAGGVRLLVIISSPHYKKPNDGTLRLGVSPGIDLGHTLACFVCVYSSADAQASAFWFTKPTAEGPAQFFYRTIYLDGPVGLNSMALSLLPSLYTQSGKGVAGDRKTSTLHLARFFQMFILGPDMGLGSSVIAWSPFPFGNVEPPTTTRRLEQSGSRRKKLMLHLGDAFVVPDGFDDHDASPGGSSGYTAASGVEKGKTNRRTTTDFTFLSTHLEQLIRDQASRKSAAAQLLATPLPAIRAVIEASIAKDHSSFHLLSEVDELRQGQADVDMLQTAWVAYGDELQDPKNERASAFERRAYVFQPDNQRLRESIEGQALIPDNASEEYRQRQRHVVRQVTAEAYMSLLNISVAPPSTGPSDAEEVQPEGSTSQPMSPMAGQSPPESFTSSLPSRPGHRRGSSAGHDNTADPVVARLRKYLPSAAGIQPRTGHQSLLLSHWPEQPGSDVRDYSWKPGESGADEEMQLQRKRREEARRRKLEKRQLSLPPDGAGESSTQPLPRTVGVFSSQSQVASSSQGQGPPSSLFASQSMSQVIPGPHGGRPPQAKKKSKIKKEGRMRGFR